VNKKYPKAEAIAVALGGRRVQNGWIVHCPAHDDCVPSCCVTDSKRNHLLVFCHAGCTQDAVISALKRLGLWGGSCM
jgi:putative DNA primase/helicase